MTSVRLPNRHAQPAADYLAQHGVDVFLRDVVQQVLALRGDQPLLTISKYFSAAARGAHVSGRAFAFVDACARNRLAFVRLFQTSFAANIDAHERLVVEDYHQLCQMLCPDFPVRVVRAAARPLPDTTLAFVDLSRALHLYFFYRRFLKEVECIFRDATALVRDGGGAGGAGGGGAGGGGVGGGDGGDGGAKVVLDESGTEVVSYDCNLVRATLTQMFYDSSGSGGVVVGGRDVGNPGGGGERERITGVWSASLRVAANSTYFEPAAARRSEDASHDRASGMCVPPYWGLEGALDSACDPSTGGCSWTAFVRSFLAIEGLVAQLRDATLKPPMCAIATSAVACDHEAKAYRLMEAMVISDVTAQAKSNKSLETRSGIEGNGGSSGDGKRNRRKKSQRRR